MNNGVAGFDGKVVPSGLIKTCGAAGGTRSQAIDSVKEPGGQKRAIWKNAGRDRSDRHLEALVSKTVPSPANPRRFSAHDSAPLRSIQGLPSKMGYKPCYAHSEYALTTTVPIAKVFCQTSSSENHFKMGKKAPSASKRRPNIYEQKYALRTKLRAAARRRGTSPVSSPIENLLQRRLKRRLSIRDTQKESIQVPSGNSSPAGSHNANTPEAYSHDDELLKAKKAAQYYLPRMPEELEKRDGREKPNIDSASGPADATATIELTPKSSKKVRFVGDKSVLAMFTKADGEKRAMAPHLNLQRSAVKPSQGMFTNVNEKKSKSQETLRDAVEKESPHRSNYPVSNGSSEEKWAIHAMLPKSSGKKNSERKSLVTGRSFLVNPRLKTPQMSHKTVSDPNRDLPRNSVEKSGTSDGTNLKRSEHPQEKGDDEPHSTRKKQKLDEANLNVTGNDANSMAVSTPQTKIFRKGGSESTMSRHGGSHKGSDGAYLPHTSSVIRKDNGFRPGFVRHSKHNSSSQRLSHTTPAGSDVPRTRGGTNLKRSEHPQEKGDDGNCYSFIIYTFDPDSWCRRRRRGREIPFAPKEAETKRGEQECHWQRCQFNGGLNAPDQNLSHGGSHKGSDGAYLPHTSSVIRKDNSSRPGFVRLKKHMGSTQRSSPSRSARFEVPRQMNVTHERRELDDSVGDDDVPPKTHSMSQYAAGKSVGGASLWVQYHPTKYKSRSPSTNKKTAQLSAFSPPEPVFHSIKVPRKVSLKRKIGTVEGDPRDRVSMGGAFDDLARDLGFKDRNDDDPFTFAHFAEFFEFYRDRHEDNEDNLREVQGRMEKLIKQLYSRSADDADSVDDVGDDVDNSLSGFNIKHRSTKSVKLAAAIREYAMELMGRESARDPVTEPVDPGTLALFEAGRHSGPSANAEDDKGEFRLDLLGTYTSRWNKAAAAAFAKGFISCDDYARIQTTEKELRIKFSKHIRTIQKHYVRQRDGEVPRPSLKDIEAATRNRTKTLGRQRVAGALSHKDTVANAPIINKLGVVGISDDSDDHGEGERRYRISAIDWRNPLVIPWLRVHDKLYVATRFNAAAKATRGNWVRIRYPVMKPRIVKKVPPKGLPRIFYKPSYLKKLYDAEVQALEIDERPFNLDHTDAVKELAKRFEKVTGPNTPPDPLGPQDRPIFVNNTIRRASNKRGLRHSGTKPRTK
ncbi:hypothetical protein SCHPADRAFT_895763 [Schizopora paradoxa]|uniref:Uncharacterized protein n=1 Tax=Schizopora paradoxa TaxID=27342 RepID=A0A0H2R2S0_9AGAM|nr:hypothetical protein SCHPADRAFT_895763 [Schizopora paradoxa]